MRAPLESGVVPEGPAHRARRRVKVMAVDGVAVVKDEASREVKVFNLLRNTHTESEAWAKVCT